MPDSDDTQPAPLDLPGSGDWLAWVTQRCEDQLAEAQQQVGLVKAGSSDAPVVLTAWNKAETALANAGSVALWAEVHPDAAVRDRADELSQQVQKYVTELGLDRDLYAVLDALSPDGLDDDARRVLDHTLRDFRRAGVDRTGLVGPRDWSNQTFPEGKADHPVTGVSWYEAAAFAKFAGKSLPTLYHWFRASGRDENYSDILQLSNFDGKGASRAGERAGLGPWGTYDMAGNVKEWVANPVAQSERYYILGGGWNEPSYRFAETDGQNPWERLETFGVRQCWQLPDRCFRFRRGRRARLGDRIRRRRSRGAQVQAVPRAGRPVPVGQREVLHAAELPADALEVVHVGTMPGEERRTRDAVMRAGVPGDRQWTGGGAGTL